MLPKHHVAVAIPVGHHRCKFALYVLTVTPSLLARTNGYLPASAAAAGSLATATTTETVVGTYVLQIDNFSGTKDLGVGEKIQSSSFRVGGHSWRISCCPSGADAQSAGWVSLFLLLHCPRATDKVEAKCIFTVLEEEDKEEETSAPCILVRPSKQINLCTYTSTNVSSSCCDLIQRKNIEPSCLKGNCLLVRCDVYLVKEFPTIQPPELHRHLGDLFASQVGGDVKFKVGDELFTAHKYVLAARSSVFRAQLFGPPGKEEENIVEVDDIEPKVFKALLRFIYTESLVEVESGGDKMTMVQHLLVAAKRYAVKLLAGFCYDILYNGIDASTAATTLLLAEKHGYNELKKARVTFLENLLASVRGPADDQTSQACSLSSSARKRQRS